MGFHTERIITLDLSGSMKCLFWLISASALALIGCSTVDKNPDRPVTSRYGAASEGVLAGEAKAAMATFPRGHSGFHLLERADDALNWRLALVDHATQSIDIQYYLWQVDETGMLLMSRIIEAADRGVRVRILIDDLLFDGEEKKMAALCHHPNIEVRIFNPKFSRDGGLPMALEVFARFKKLNRRMHNKTFCVDDQIAILGGRNIGNEYFGLSEEFNFVDLDVMTLGPVIPDIAESFDAFWNCELSFPGVAFAETAGAEEMPGVISEIREFVDSRQDFLREASYPVRRKNWSREFARLRLAWHTGPAIFLDDVPTLEEERGRERFVEKAVSLLGERSSGELLFSSPYLLPGKKVNGVIEDYISDGAEVKLLTTNLTSNNHLFVHSHYRKHRRPLLSKGVRLYEMRDDPSEKVRAVGDAESFRSDKIALHVKAGVGDRSRCFIGSLNLDPRAVKLNTENGLLIESPGLSRQLADHLDLLMSSDNAWELSMDKNRQLIWRSRGEELRIQPAPDGKSRVIDFFMGLVPIGHLL